MENEEITGSLQTKASNSQCANCGGNLVFSPKHQSLYCRNCESKFHIDAIFTTRKYDLNSVQKYGDHDLWASQAKVAKCETCGAEIVVDGLNVTSKCPYCGCDYVISSNHLEGIKPDAVVPFAFDENEAANLYVQGIKKKFWAPHAFKKKLPSTQIRGIYIPSFAFDSATSSSYTGVLVKKHTHKDSKGNTHTTYEHIKISGTKQIQFNDVIIESSTKMENKDMKSLLPYKFKEGLRSYDSDFLRGYPCESYNEDISVSYDKAKKEMEGQIKSSILDEYHSKYHYDSVDSFSMSTLYSNEKYSYRLLPVYCFEFLYKKKKYITFMNGQTGKVGIGYPKSVMKKVAIALIIILIVAGIIVLAAFSK